MPVTPIVLGHRQLPHPVLKDHGENITFLFNGVKVSEGFLGINNKELLTPIDPAKSEPGRIVDVVNKSYSITNESTNRYNRLELECRRPGLRLVERERQRIVERSFNLYIVLPVLWWREGT